MRCGPRGSVLSTGGCSALQSAGDYDDVDLYAAAGHALGFDDARLLDIGTPFSLPVSLRMSTAGLTTLASGAKPGQFETAAQVTVQ